MLDSTAEVVSPGARSGGKRVHVAEQVSIGCAPEVVVELLSQRPATWMQPFLLLAWNEGDAALRRLGRATRGTTDQHQLRLGDPVPRTGGTTSFTIAWTVDSSDLFHRLRGELLVLPFESGTVLALRATCTGNGHVEAGGTALRPVELVVRSLLGHIRTAIE